MRQFFSSLAVSLERRFSSPFVGAFALCWLGVNIKEIISLISLSGQERVDYLNTLTLDPVTDLALPVFLSLMYIFFIPLLQRYLDISKYQFIDKNIQKDKSEQAFDELKIRSKINKEKSISSEKYWEEITSKEIEERHKEKMLKLEDWDNEKKQLEFEISNLKINLNLEEEKTRRSAKSIARLEVLEVDRRNLRKIHALAQRIIAGDFFDYSNQENRLMTLIGRELGDSFEKIIEFQELNQNEKDNIKEEFIDKIKNNDELSSLMLTLLETKRKRQISEFQDGDVIKLMKTIRDQIP